MTLAKRAREVLLEKKATDVVILDVRNVSTVTDYYVIATGNNRPHVKALSSHLNRTFRTDGTKKERRSGSPESGWIVNDYVDAVVHIFAKEQRGYYALEQLWADARKVE